ncbi:hypothetical protein F4802DRAFT_265674 [Xylaria palmicola]|nr:hypothetical protein F4802DRAFT_265674 [Xylaria palmicola]
MPKWDKARNYYADLELQPSASADEIKKQFKKLALKYHPDRNPGREAEVNPKFQIIQSAHEILTDETLRRQYDEARRSYATRYPGASGVRGNPWQDAAKAYPPPPRRQPNNPPRPATGAQRYESFASSMPRHSRPNTPKDETQFRRSNAEAWDHIRPNSSRKNTQPRPATPGRSRTSAAPARDPPRPTGAPPRTAYQKQKAEAAFGSTKKTGFTPRTPGIADEPPVTNKNYFTNRTHTNLFTEPDDETEPSHQDANASTFADPLGPFKDLFVDNRQRTPYHTPGGEKTSLFDNTPGLGRSASTRTPPRAFEMPGAFPRTRPRSSSPARSSSNDAGSEDSIKANPNINGTANRNNQTAEPKASERYNFSMPVATDIPSQTATAFPEHITRSAAARSKNSRPPAYGSQTLPTQPHSKSTAAASRLDSSCRGRAVRVDDLPSRNTDYSLSDPSSEEKQPHGSAFLLPLEEYQRRTVDRLVRNNSMANENGSRNDQRVDAKPKHISTTSTTKHETEHANSIRTSSFNFAGATDATSASAGHKTFAGSSAENINTRFVDNEILDDWEFKAGSSSAGEATAPSRPRPQSRSRPTRRQTPLSKPTTPVPIPPVQEASSTLNIGEQRFSAGAWSEQIGPQHFEPQSSNSASASPTRRAALKKAKSFKMTAGTAAVVDDGESEGWQEVHLPSTGPTAGRTSIVPDAMDIDTPPADKAEDIPEPPKVNSARKYSTEPHRADWRAGDVNGVASEAAGPTSSTNGAKEKSYQPNGVQKTAGTTQQAPFQHVGSEDSEEFRTTFADFKNIEPFADPVPSGLKSFADLRSTLPFDSRPSEQIPLDINKPSPGPLDFPPVPVAPRLPPTMAVTSIRPNNSSFRKYAQDFSAYMDKWEAFNDKVMDHFATRQKEFKQRRSRRGANWLEDGVLGYLTEIDQDLDVQKRYANACVEHRKSLAEYKEFKDRVR